MGRIRTYSRPYVGLKNGQRTVFRSATLPTQFTHGELYDGTIGPFHTMRGARFMAQFGANNPHCRCVGEAEKLAKRLQAEGKTVETLP